MLEKLTPEQEALIPKVRDEWLKIGLSTEPVNRLEAEEAIKEVYQNAGLEPPKTIIWLDSPLAGCIGAYLLTSGEVRNQVRDQVMDQVRNQVWAQVWNQVGAQVRDQVRDQVRNQVWDQVWDQVGDQVGAQVWNQVRDQVGAQVWNQVGAKISKCGCGQHDASWLSFYHFFQQIELTQETQKLSGLIRLSQNCGWWWPFENCVILTERPNRLIRDDQHRLHCEDGTALQYRDGFAIYSWHGVRVFETIILQPEQIKIEDVVKEQNQEVKRVMLERYGWNKLLKDLNADTINTDKFGTLYRTTRLGDYLDGEDPIAMFIKVTDPSTGREYCLRVPPDTTTAQAAVAWTFNTTEADYQPAQET